MKAIELPVQEQSGTGSAERQRLCDLTLGQLNSNISQSRSNIIKQKQIIARLNAQGHSDMAADAIAYLSTMYNHLTTQRVMLTRMWSGIEGF